MVELLIRSAVTSSLFHSKPTELDVDHWLVDKKQRALDHVDQKLQNGGVVNV